MSVPMGVMGRREILLAGAALTLAMAGCNSGGGGAASADDMILGAADAPVTLIEYASATCPHCAEFHEEAWEQLKANYIDTGKVRFIFREFPTPPPQVAVAGFQVARCNGATPEQYFARLGAIFRTQQSLFQSLGTDGGRQYFINLGSDAGLSQDQVMACISDQAGGQRIQRVVEAGERDFHVSGTPTLILNGEELTAPGTRTYEGLSAAIDAALAR